MTASRRAKHLLGEALVAAAFLAGASCALAETQAVDGYTWTYRVDGDSAEIYNGGSCAVSPSPSGKVMIPGTLGDRPVTGIGAGAFKLCGDMTAVVIPDSVKSIDDFAFSCCSGLASLTVGNGVTNIDEWAFFCCDKLAVVTLGRNVASIGAQAFFDCDKITSLVLPASVKIIGAQAFSTCDSLKTVTYQGDCPTVIDAEGEIVTGGDNLYCQSPDAIVSVVPSGNDTWKAALAEGVWMDRVIAGDADSLTIGGGRMSMSRSYSCDAKSGESFSVACNSYWKATPSDSWITITSGASGCGNGKISYSLSENTNAGKREGKITVKCGSIALVCTITQKVGVVGDAHVGQQVRDRKRQGNLQRRCEHVHEPAHCDHKGHKPWPHPYLYHKTERQVGNT